jgi:hypothetical protein
MVLHLLLKMLVLIVKLALLIDVLENQDASMLAEGRA